MNFMPEWLKLILSSLPGVATAIVAAYLAARFSIRRLYEEKWWDRKAQAYTEIIDCLSHLVQCFDCYTDQPGRIDLPKHLHEGYLPARQKLDKATTVGAFVISEEAAGVLAELQGIPRLSPDENPTSEIYQSEFEFYSAALNAIRDCARKDLHR